MKFDPKTLEHILDNLREGVIAHDRDRKIFFFNKKAEEITGLSRKEVLGRDCHEAFGAPLCGEACSFCDDGQDRGRSEYPSVLLAQNGETKHIEISITPMKDDKGRVTGALASFSDIAEIMGLREKASRPGPFAGIVGQDIRMLRLFQQISDVARYDYPVHISGETGTGKELTAAAIHSQSPRAAAPFVPINCGALPETLIESELFGHVRGAFSGAVRDKKGRFELARGGVIFLDEVAELSLKVQVKLLRFLQEGTFEKVGGEGALSVNARVISASNKDIKKEAAAGRFREDLYYRLNVIPIHLPPLRQRKNDIPLLAAHFLSRAGSGAGDGGKTGEFLISPEALSRMMDHPWPGNVRELQNAMMFAIVKSGGGVIRPRHLPMELSGPGPAGGKRRGPLKKLDAEIVSKALTQTGGNKAAAARLMGVSRATLYRFLAARPDETGE